ncbi:hypothetical protein [Streptomyces sp. NPDC002644]
MNATALAVALSLASAVAYASAAVSQERLVARARGASLGALLVTPAWWASACLNLGGALLHIGALRYGPLTVVQPLGALTLVVAVPMGARVARRRVHRTERRGTALTLLGLTALLLTVSGPAPDRALSPASTLAVAGGTVALLVTLCAPRDPAGLLRAVASGVASAVGSAFAQTLAVSFARGSARSVPAAQTVVLAVLVVGFAVGSVLLAQSAYRGGLGAPLATSTLANPLAAAAIGLWLLGERFHGGTLGVLLATAGFAAAARGVVLLTRRTPRSARSAGSARPGPGAASAGPAASAPSPASTAPVASTAATASTASARSRRPDEAAPYR